MIVPTNISNYRWELCRTCKTPCEHQNDAGFRAEGNNLCPIGRWKQYQLYVKAKWKGLGDAVASVAQPIAGAIDMATRGRTKLKGCSACAKRKEMLNQLLPFGAVR